MHRGAVLILFLLATSHARPNDSPTLVGGGSVGYVRLSIPKTTDGVVGLPPQSNPYPATFGFGTTIHVGTAIPVAEQWRVGAGMGIASNSFTFETTEPTLFNVDGVPTPGTFTHTLDFQWSSVLATASVSYSLSSVIGIDALLDAEFPTTMSGTATETISDPDGVTYTNGDTSRIRAQGDEPYQTSVAIAARVHVNIPLSDRFTLQPFLSVRQQLISLSPNVSLTPTSLSLGADISFALFRSQPIVDSLTHTAVVPDTNYLADTTTLTTPDTLAFLATALSVSLQSNQASAASSVRVLTKRVLRMRSSPLTNRDAGATGDMGIEPARQMVDTVIDADPPRVVVRSQTIADGGFRSATVRGSVDGTVVWMEQWAHATDTTFIWELRNVPGEVLSSDTIRLAFTATATDSAGTTAQAIPRSVILNRENVSASSDHDVPDYIDATFTADAFTTDGLSLSGKGLVTALKIYYSRIREIEKERNRKVELQGSEALVRIVKDALGITTATLTINNSKQVRVLLIK